MEMTKAPRANPTTTSNKKPGEILDSLDIVVGDKNRVVEVSGFLGDPLIDCKIHGTQRLIFIEDLSQEQGKLVWLCSECQDKCLQTYLSLEK